MNDAGLPTAFNRPFREAVCVDTRAAYGLAAERIYSPENGWGALLFGIAVFLNLDRRFSARFVEGGPLRHVQTMRGPELRAGDQLRVRWKKVGFDLSPPGDVLRPSDVLVEMAQMNMSPQMSLSLDASPLLTWVIAHSGNAADGLLTIHLAAPHLSKDGRKVVAWRESVGIYDVRRPGVDFPDLEPPGLPEPSELPPMEIDFRPDAPSALDDEVEDTAQDVE
jgi:hypothetical protein